MWDWKGEKREIWALVSNDKPGWSSIILRARRRISFGIGYVLLESAMGKLIRIKPKKVLRADNVTLELDTGWWHYGKVKLAFDSSSEADIVEQEAKKLFSNRSKENWSVSP